MFLLFFLCFRSGTSEWRLIRTRVLCCSGADAKSERGPVSSAGQTAHLLAASQAHACKSEGTQLLIASRKNLTYDQSRASASARPRAGQPLAYARSPTNFVPDRPIS